MTTDADNWRQRSTSTASRRPSAGASARADEFSARLLLPRQRQRHPLRAAVAARNDSGPTRRPIRAVMIADRPAELLRRGQRLQRRRRAYGTAQLHAPLRRRRRAAHGAAPGGYDRDQRAGDDPLLRRSQPDDRRRHRPRLSDRRRRRWPSPTTPLTRGTQNKVQDMTRDLPAERLQQPLHLARPQHALLAGIDARARGVQELRADRCQPGSCSTRTRRARRSARRTTAPGRRALRACAANRTFDAKALGVYVQDLVQVAPDWKLLAGLRWDRFEGDYTAARPTATTARTRRSRTDSLWSQPLRRALPADRRESYHLSTAPRSTPRASPTSTTRRARRRRPRPAATSSSAPSSTCSTAASRAALALFHSTKYNERNRDSPTASRSRLHAVRQAARRRPRARPRRPHHAALGGLRLVRLDPGRRDRQGGLRRDPDRRARRRPAVADAAPQRHDLARPTRSLPSLRVGGGLNARSSQTPNRNPAGIVAPSFVTGDLMAEYTGRPGRAQAQRHERDRQALRRFALPRPLHPGQAAHAVGPLTVRF